jgi:peptide/nickel transport system substrate-binding protein
MATAQRLLTLAILLTVLGCGPQGQTAPETPPSVATGNGGEVDFLVTNSEVGVHGGRLVVDLRAEPTSWNPLVVDGPSRTLMGLLVADLVHVDRASQETVPALASGWTASDDGRHYELELRRGVRFSDGHPLEVDDVLFTFRVHLDEEVDSPQRDLLVVGGEPITVTKIDDRRIAVHLAAPYPVGVQLFDSIGILPQHLLEPAYLAGELASTWGLDSAPREIVGLGPYRLSHYVPGDRVELERNPHYWKADSADQRLPYLDRVIFRFATDENTQALRFQNGDTDLISGLSASGYDLLAKEQDRRGYRLHDLGPDLRFEALFFNLKPPSVATSRLEERQRWFQDKTFRHAVSLAIDRESLARLVYRERATPISGIVSPSNRLWLNKDILPPRHDLEGARALLEEAGYHWRKDGTLLDEGGTAVSFHLVTNASNRQRTQMMAIVQEDLARLGIEVEAIALEFGALMDRITKTSDYEACLLGMQNGIDPNILMNLALSGGGYHFWHMGQEEPATEWEAEIDRLMAAQLIELDTERRKALFDRVQAIFAEELPLIFLVSPNILVGSKENLGNFRPAVLGHSTLWNIEELFWRNRLAD